MSSADDAPTRPSDARLERGLREQVAKCFKADDMENLTLKRLRAAVETTLDLGKSWFKDDSVWNARSKEIVSDEVSRQEEYHDHNQPQSDDEGSVKRVKPTQKREPSHKAPQPAKKRRKADVPQAVDEASAVVPPLKDQIDDSSSLSEVLDDEPPPKKKRGKGVQKKPAKATPSKSKPKTPAKSSSVNLSSEDAEVKHLQSCLVKCGVRKVWGKELLRFDTATEKIEHLKGMLTDVGMDGRFSDEKARKIKEQRELAADLEEIQQGDKHWGMSKEDDMRPARRRISRAPIAAPSESSSNSDEAGETEDHVQLEPDEPDEPDDIEDDGNISTSD